MLLGAKPVFADVDPDSGSITAATIAPLITTRTKAIVVVRYATRDHWTKETRVDGQWQDEREYYLVPREHLISWEDFIQQARERLGL